MGRSTEISSVRRLLMALLTASLVSGVSAQEQVSCALIPGRALDLDKSLTFELLTVALSNKPGLALLERARIERAVEERSLQLAFAAGGVSARRQLGTVLKARLLAIMFAGEREAEKAAEGQPEAPKTRYVMLVVADTKTGLRLVTEARLWDDASPEATVAAIGAAVERAAKMIGEKVTAIAAVPPFVNDDLTREHDALQEACAQLTRAWMLRLPGVRVVEIAEAQAIAKDQAMTDGEAVERPLYPLFVLGRFRNEGRGPQRRITLSLEVKQREQTLLERKSEPLVPEGAPAFVRDVLAQMTRESLRLAQPPFDPESEIRVLVERSGVFEALGVY